MQFRLLRLAMTFVCNFNQFILTIDQYAAFAIRSVRICKKSHIVSLDRFTLHTFLVHKINSILLLAAWVVDWKQRTHFYSVNKKLKQLSSRRSYGILNKWVALYDAQNKKKNNKTKYTRNVFKNSILMKCMASGHSSLVSSGSVWDLCVQLQFDLLNWIYDRPN